MPDPTDKRATPYHDHLDACRQCAEHPFDLCPAGIKALEDEVRALGIDLDAPPDLGHMPGCPMRGIR